MKAAKLTWKTKAGAKISIVEMTDVHIANTIAMLKRRAEELENDMGAGYSYSGGEMAEYYTHGAADDSAAAFAKCWAVIHAFEDEQRRRHNRPQP